MRMVARSCVTLRHSQIAIAVVIGVTPARVAVSTLRVATLTRRASREACQDRPDRRRLSDGPQRSAQLSHTSFDEDIVRAISTMPQCDVTMGGRRAAGGFPPSLGLRAVARLCVLCAAVTCDVWDPASLRPGPDPGDDRDSMASLFSNVSRKAC